MLIEIVPDKALVDEKVCIRLSVFEPNHFITLRAQMRDDLGRLWESHATFKADTQGAVDVCSQKSLSGSYDDADPMGLFWSMALDPGEKELSPFTKRTRASELTKETRLAHLFYLYGLLTYLRKFIK